MRDDHRIKASLTMIVGTSIGSIVSFPAFKASSLIFDGGLVSQSASLIANGLPKRSDDIRS